MMKIKDIEFTLVPGILLERDEYVKSVWEKHKHQMGNEENVWDPFYINFKTSNFPQGIDILIHSVKLVEDPNDSERMRVQFGHEVVRYAGIDSIEPHREEINDIVSQIINGILEAAVAQE